MNDDVDGTATNDDEWRRMVMNGDSEEQRWTVTTTNSDCDGAEWQL